MDFYGDLAEDYDRLTGDVQRGAAAREFAGELVRRCRPAAVLDAACGTGLYSLAFAELGLVVSE